MAVAHKLREWFHRKKMKSGTTEVTNADEDRVTPLPKKLVTAVFILSFLNAMSTTMVFSYIPKLVKTFGVSEISVGFYVGTIGSSLFLAKIPFSIFWGYLTDVKGQKFAVVFATIALALTTLLHGFSYNFWWTLVTRFGQGCSNGLFIVSKSIISSICDDSNMPMAMSLIMSSYCLGLIVGPSCGGFLVFPHEQYPETFSKDNIFSKYPILLPNLLVSLGLITVLLLAIHIIPSSSKKKQLPNGERSYLVDHIKPSKIYDTNGTSLDSTVSKKDLNNPKEYLTISLSCVQYPTPGITAGYFQLVEPLSSKANSSKQQHQQNLTWKQKWDHSKAKKILSNKWCVLCCVLYGTFSIVGIGLDELMPLYLSTSREYRGLGFSPQEIGISYFISALIVLVLQLTAIAWVTKKFGSRKIFIWSILFFGSVIPMLPLVTYFESGSSAMWIVLILIQTLIRTPCAGGFLAINILINNTVESDMVGTANGLGMSLASLGRMISPTFLGSIYSWSLKNVKGAKGNTDPLDFPFNQFFSFFVVTLMSILLCFVPALKVPPSYDNKLKSSSGSSKGSIITSSCAEDDEAIFEDNKNGFSTTSNTGKVVDITIGYYNPVCPENINSSL